MKCSGNPTLYVVTCKGKSTSLVGAVPKTRHGAFHTVYPGGTTFLSSAIHYDHFYEHENKRSLSFIQVPSDVSGAFVLTPSSGSVLRSALSLTARCQRIEPEPEVLLLCVMTFPCIVASAQKAFSSKAGVLSDTQTHVNGLDVLAYIKGAQNHTTNRVGSISFPPLSIIKVGTLRPMECAHIGLMGFGSTRLLVILKLLETLDSCHTTARGDCLSHKELLKSVPLEMDALRSTNLAGCYIDNFISSPLEEGVFTSSGKITLPERHESLTVTAVSSSSVCLAQESFVRCEPELIRYALLGGCIATNIPISLSPLEFTNGHRSIGSDSHRDPNTRKYCSYRYGELRIGVPLLWM
ncbi:hypothetical protein Tco_0281063 [Tanacetum coccineum]